MDTSTINLLVSIGALLVGIVTWFIYQRRTKRVREEKEARADREIQDTLTRLLTQGSGNLDISVLEALMNSKYRALGLDMLPIDKMRIILENLIAEFTGNIFIPYEIGQDLIKRVLLLKDKFEGRKSNLEEVVGNWRRLSIPKIIFRVVSLTVIALASGLFVVILALLFVTGAAETMVTYYIAILLATLMIIYTESKTLQEKRSKSGRQLHNVLENNIIKIFRDSEPSASVERNVRIEADGQIAQVDLVMKSNGEKLPIEIRQGNVSIHTIDQIVEVMNKMDSNKGLLITTSKVRTEIREIARQKSVIVIDDVASETDIVDGLKNTKLFS